MNTPIIHKHICRHCNETYYTINNAPAVCPFHYVQDSNNYTIKDWQEIYKLRQEYVGKVIDIDKSAMDIAIGIEVLDKENIEFIAMPSHRICIIPISTLKQL